MSQLGQLVGNITGIVKSVAADAGTATPTALGVITLAGGSNIGTSAAGSTVTINLDGTTNHAIQLGNVGGSLTSLAVGATGTVLTGVTGADPAFSATPTVTTMYATTFDTNVAAAGVTLSGTTLSADGTDVDININITAKGAGQVIIDDLQLTTDLAVTEGGTGASTLLDHGLLVGSGTAAVDALAVGATGTVLQGVTGADPTWSTATYPSTVTKGDVLVASANNVVGVVNDVVNAGYVLTANAAAAPTFQALPAPVVGSFASDAETIAGAVTNKAVAPSNLAAKLGSQTLHALPIGAGSTAALNWLAVGANGETIMGSTGADCGWTNSPQFGGSVTATNDITSTAGSISSLSGSMISRDATNTSTGPSAYFQKVRVAATIQSGDELGKMRFTGYDGTGYITGAKITSTNSGTVATNRIAGDLQFYTHPDSVVALPSEPTLRMTIASTGATTIASPDSGVGLTVSGGGITCTSGAITATSGNVVVTAGDITMPISTSSTGNIYWGATPVLRAASTDGTSIAYGIGAASTGGTLIYTGSSYATMIGNLAGSSHFNTGCTYIGYGAGSRRAGADQYSVYLGYNAGTRGDAYNICIGYQAGRSGSSTSGSDIYIGNAGANETHKIRIGTYGTGSGQQDTAYIAGVVHGTNGLVADAGNISATAGSVSASTTVTAGTNLVSTAGNLNLPFTSSTIGAITFGGTRYMHVYDTGGGLYGGNLFIGRNCGNYTTTGYANYSLGSYCGSSLTSGKDNYMAGDECGRYITSGGNNNLYGKLCAVSLTQGYDNVAAGSYRCLGRLTTGNANVAIGSTSTLATDSTYIGAGYGLATGSESSNILINATGVTNKSNQLRIGDGTGTGRAKLNDVYISGIYTFADALGASQKVIVVDSNDKIGGVATLPPSLGGAMTWTEVTGTSQAAAVNNGYITNNVALVTVTLPSTAAVGQRVAITGKGAGLWSLAQNSGQTVHFGSFDTTTGAGGSITASVRYDCIEVQCITANTDWVVIRSVGALVIV